MADPAELARGMAYKGDDVDYAEASLGNVALRGLQVHIGQRKVLGNNAGLPLLRQTQRSLAGIHFIRGKAHAATAARKTDAESGGGIGQEQKTAVGGRDGDGMIHHRLENGIEGKLRMQKHGRFEEKIEIAQRGRRRRGSGGGNRRCGVRERPQWESRGPGPPAYGTRSGGK